MLALAHSAAMSVVLPGSSTRSHSPRLRVSRTRCGRWWPCPRIRSRQPGSWSATSPNACTSLVNCFSITSRPAATIVLRVEQRARGEALRQRVRHRPRSRARPGRARRAASPRWSASAARPRRRAGRGSAAAPCPRCAARTTGAPGGRRPPGRAASWTAQASSAGVTVTSTSASSRVQRVLERDVGQRRELLVPPRRDQHRLALVQVAVRQSSTSSRARRRYVDQVVDRDPRRRSRSAASRPPAAR